jgi:hypothetical protein
LDFPRLLRGPLQDVAVSRLRADGYLDSSLAELATPAEIAEVEAKGMYVGTYLLHLSPAPRRVKVPVELVARGSGELPPP